MSTEHTEAEAGDEPRQRIERVVQPDAELAALVFEKHTEIFEAVLEDHPIYQGLVDEDYDPLVASPDASFYLAWKGDELVGHMVLTTNFDDVHWLSRPYFEKYFPKECKERRLHFVAALGVSDGCSPKLVRGLIDALTIDIAREGGVAVAQFRMTESNARLPILIAGRNNSLAVARLRRLPSEQFMAFEMDSLRDEPLNLTEGLRSIVEAPGWVAPKSALGTSI